MKVVCSHCQKVLSNKSSLAKHQRTNFCIEKQAVNSSATSCDLEAMRQREDQLQRIVFELHKTVMTLTHPIAQAKYEAVFCKENLGELPCVLDLGNIERTRQILESSASEDWESQEAITTFICDKILRADSGTRLYIATDAGGKIFAYRDTAGVVKIDVAGYDFRKHLVCASFLEVGKSKATCSDWLEDYIASEPDFRA